MTIIAGLKLVSLSLLAIGVIAWILFLLFRPKTHIYYDPDYPPDHRDHKFLKF